MEECLSSLQRPWRHCNVLQGMTQVARDSGAFPGRALYKGPVPWKRRSPKLFDTILKSRHGSRTEVEPPA